MIEDPTWIAIGANSFVGLPIIIWIVVVLFVFNHVLLSKTTFGRRAYLTGGNREAAVYSGIKVDRVKITIFMISGIMAAISGILLSSRLYSAQTNAGTSYELDAIAAAVLGGTSLSGGVGTMIGTHHRCADHRHHEQRHEHAVRSLLLSVDRQGLGHPAGRLARRSLQAGQAIMRQSKVLTSARCW